MASLFASVSNTRPVVQYLFTPSVMRNIQVDDIETIFSYVFDNTLSTGHSIRVIATDERKRRIAEGVSMFSKYGQLLNAKSAIGMPYYHDNTLYCIIANVRPNMTNNEIQFIGNDADRQATRIALRAMSGIIPQTDPVAAFYVISRLLMAYVDGLDLRSDYAKALFKLVECQFGMTIDNRTMLQILIQGTAQYYKAIDYRLQVKSMSSAEIWMGFMALMEYFGYNNIFVAQQSIYEFIMSANNIKTFTEALAFLKKTYGYPMSIVMKNECSYSNLQRRMVYNHIYISSCCNVTADHQFSGMCYCGKEFNWSLADKDNCTEIIQKFSTQAHTQVATTSSVAAAISAATTAVLNVATTAVSSIANIADSAISSLVSMDKYPTSAITVEYIKRGVGNRVVFTMQGNIGCGKNYVTSKLAAHMRQIGYDVHVVEPDLNRGDSGLLKVQNRACGEFLRNSGKICVIFNMCNTKGVISNQYNGFPIKPDTVILIRPAFSQNLIAYQHYCISNVLRRHNVHTTDYWLNGNDIALVYKISRTKMEEFFRTNTQYSTTIVTRVDENIADKYRAVVHSFNIDAEIARIL
jgi:hypothetical protein